MASVPGSSALPAPPDRAGARAVTLLGSVSDLPFATGRVRVALTEPIRVGNQTRFASQRRPSAPHPRCRRHGGSCTGRPPGPPTAAERRHLLVMFGALSHGLLVSPAVRSGNTRPPWCRRRSSSPPTTGTASSAKDLKCRVIPQRSVWPRGQRRSLARPMSGAAVRPFLPSTDTLGPATLKRVTWPGRRAPAAMPRHATFASIARCNARRRHSRCGHVSPSYLRDEPHPGLGCRRSSSHELPVLDPGQGRASVASSTSNISSRATWSRAIWSCASVPRINGVVSLTIASGFLQVIHPRGQCLDLNHPAGRHLA